MGRGWRRTPRCIIQKQYFPASRDFSTNKFASCQVGFRSKKCFFFSPTTEYHHHHHHYYYYYVIALKQALHTPYYLPSTVINQYFTFAALDRHNFNYRDITAFTSRVSLRRGRWFLPGAPYPAKTWRFVEPPRIQKRLSWNNQIAANFRNLDIIFVTRSRSPDRHEPKFITSHVMRRKTFIAA
jgi:hypothetical protein